MKIAVKFCGHCAPRMDMAEFLEKLRAGAGQETAFSYFVLDGEADVLLVLNACSAQCAEQPPFPGPVVTVSPDGVDHWPVGGGDLCHAVLRALRRRYCERREAP